jgi:hypothetical protein
MSTSSVINKSLRKRVLPVLRAAGFEKADPRNGWLWSNESISVFNIRAVGAYFASVTGWPAASVCVWLGIYFPFIPRLRPGKIDDQGRMLVAESECHMRSQLHRKLAQAEYVRCLKNSGEQRRTDIWWLEPDGSNADLVAADITDAIRDVALSWYETYSDLSSSLAAVETRHDCYQKFRLAAYLASRLRKVGLAKKYVALAEDSVSEMTTRSSAKRMRRPPKHIAHFEADLKQLKDCVAAGKTVLGR